MAAGRGRAAARGTLTMDGLVIVNPNAAAGGAGRSFGAVRRVMEHRLGPVEVVLTSGPGHAIELSRQAAHSGRSRIIAVGGDGTLHEVANGISSQGDRRRSDTSGSAPEVISVARSGWITDSTLTSRRLREDGSVAWTLGVSATDRWTARSKHVGF